MIDGLVKITDRLIELVKYREEKSRRIFEKLIEPIFTDLLLIHRNYLEMFEEVQSLLPNKKERQKKHRKQLQRAYDFLCQKRVEFEPTRIRLRAIIQKLPPVGKKHNRKENFIRSVTNYLFWTQKGQGMGSVSWELAEQIYAGIARVPHSALERETRANRAGQSAILQASLVDFTPSAGDLNRYVFFTINALRRKFALASEAYADIFVSVRDE